jgi:DNA-binding response OmpR family regulator
MAASKRWPDVVTGYGLHLDLNEQELVANGQAYHVRPKEAKLLATFIQHPGQVLSRAFLMQEVWDTDFTDDTRTIEVHVAWLRKKIEANPGNPQLILTVRGVGYVFARE